MSKLLGKMIPRKSSKKKWDKDVTLVVKDQSGSEEYGLKVQKKLLLESSAFFRDIPENEMKKHKKINMEGISSVALQKIVAFLQKGCARFSNHMEAIETLKATEKLKMEDLLNICINHLITTLEPGNVCEIYDAATTLCLSHLEYSCLMVIDKHAEEILGHRGFITLKKAKVLGIIKRCTLNINSEVTVFRAVLSWGLNESLNRGLDPNNIDKFVPVVRHLLNHVRFWVMSEEERKDPEVSKYLRLLSSCELWKKDRSMSTTSQSSSGSYDLESQARHHVTSYNHNLNTFDSSQHTVKDGETFCLNLEILKGRIFLTSFKLAFGPFAKTKNTACLYVLLTATNLSTGEERSTRGTFMNTTDEASLKFTNPLSARESQKIKLELVVKKAENVCPFSIKTDVQIAMPDSKRVAMKITPVLAQSDSEETGRCIFGEIEYFH